MMRKFRSHELCVGKKIGECRFQLRHGSGGRPAFAVKQVDVRKRFHRVRINLRRCTRCDVRKPLQFLIADSDLNSRGRGRPHYTSTKKERAPWGTPAPPCARSSRSPDRGTAVRYCKPSVNFSKGAPPFFPVASRCSNAASAALPGIVGSAATERFVPSAPWGMSMEGWSNGAD